MMRLILALMVLLMAAPAGAARILLLGDSITAGTVMGEGAPFAQLLQERMPFDEVLNAGCGGSTTADWTTPAAEGFPCPFAGAYELSAEPLIDGDPVEVAVIMLGANDATGFFEPAPIEPAEYRSNLEALVLAALQDAEWVVLLTPTRNPNAAVDVAQRLVSYRNEVLGLCSMPGDQVLCGPDVQLIVHDAATGLPGLHPDALGHELIAAALLPFLASEPIAVPEPGAGIMLLFGLLGLAGLHAAGGRK